MYITIPTLTNAASTMSKRNTVVTLIVGSSGALNSPSDLRRGARVGYATAARRNLLVAGAKHFHHSGKCREPDHRPGPPDFACQLDGCIRTAKFSTVSE